MAVSGLIAFPSQMATSFWDSKVWSHLICQNSLLLFLKITRRYLDKTLGTPVIFDKTVLLGIRGASLNIGNCPHPCLVIRGFSIQRFKGSLTFCTSKDFLSLSFACVYDYRLKNYVNIIRFYNSANMLRTKSTVCIYVKLWL